MKTVYRYEMQISNGPQSFLLRGKPFGFTVVQVDHDDKYIIEFWAEHNVTVPLKNFNLQVFGTGHSIPDGATHQGTCPRCCGLVWHVYNVPVSL